MKVLITGGAGYLGSVITRNLLKKHEVIVYDNLMYNQTSLVDLCHHENFTYHYGDVREWSKLKYLVEQVDVIIPLAALVGFPRDVPDYLYTMKNRLDAKFLRDGDHAGNPSGLCAYVLCNGEVADDDDAWFCTCAFDTGTVAATRNIDPGNLPLIVFGTVLLLIQSFL